jgi:hypothetical protein
MPISCNIVPVPDLRICDADGFTSVLLAQPAFVPRRDEDTGYGPAAGDLGEAEAFVDDCLAALVETGQEHNLVVFPEAFVPRSRISPLIDFVETDSPNNTVIVAGIEGLPVHDVLEGGVLPLDDMTLAALKARVGAHHSFINAALILIRDGQGVSRSYVQPKIDPSHYEQTLPAMLTSECVSFFTCPQLSFGALICSDFIQRRGETWLPVAFVEALETAWNAKATGTSFTVDLLINIQCNPEPNHRLFREAASDLLHMRGGSVRLNQAFVLLSNWGGLWDAGEPILSCALAYQHNFWQPPSRSMADVPPSYSLTRDTITDKLNIAAIRSKDHGRVRFRMVPCSLENCSDPSRRFPLRDCYFETRDGSGEWVVQPMSAWHDRCERWLPDVVPDSPYEVFWSVPNSPVVQTAIHQKYAETRGCILGKTATDLKQDLLCLTLPFDDKRNPDTWQDPQKAALNKWASLATMFHYDDTALGFQGDDWFCFTWRDRVCIAVVDGNDIVSWERTMETYKKRFGDKLPWDPNLDRVALVLLYRHTHDYRQIHGRAEALTLDSWAVASDSCEGVRDEALRTKPDDVSRSRIPARTFWCAAADFDVVLETRDEAAFRAALESICEPTLD